LGISIISFKQTNNSLKTVTVYNIKGQLIQALINNQKLSLSEHSFVWDGKTNSGQPVAAGIYFFKMKSGTFSAKRKMILMK
jgi:flagellar hook assembly protein FlgD